MIAIGINSFETHLILISIDNNFVSIEFEVSVSHISSLKVDNFTSKSIVDGHIWKFSIEIWVENVNNFDFLVICLTNSSSELL